MSNTKTVMSQAANTLVKPLEVEDVFSTYLYTGNGSTQTITNGIDLAGEGGLVWIKGRNATTNHALVDTERGGANSIASDTTAAQRTDGAYGLTFNSNGFDSTGGNLNVSGREQASWTFRKAPKFFDVVTYTGNRVDTNSFQDITHNLGSTPGMIIVKETSSADDWMVYHRSVSVDGTVFKLNTTDAATNYGNVIFDVSEINDSSFRVGNMNNINASGATYVAYLFAHNDGDGTFGPDGDADIIKCGSLTADASGGATVDLGWEPQWLLYKKTNGAQGWLMHDTMRGWDTSGVVNNIYANSSNAESNIANSSVKLSPTATGFSSTGNWFGANSEYIYMAIRRGTKAPESATEVFMPVKSLNPGSPAFISGFPVDMSIHKDTTGGATINGARLIQNRKLSINTTAAEGSGNDEMMYDFMNGFYSPLDYGSPPGSIGSTNFIGWQWKRAPGFFDAVAYTGDGSSGSYAHNLGVVPELKIIKSRSAGASWVVGGSAITGGTATGYLVLNASDAKVVTVGEDYWGSVDSDTTFSVRPNNGWSNFSGRTYIAYLFASLPGISKVGSFSHTYGGTTNVDCGFTSGARFVLWKRTDGTRHWEVFDTTRGIVAGNDAYLRLSDTAAETSGDYIDPYSAGFSIGSALGSGDFIFYAIA